MCIHICNKNNEGVTNFRRSGGTGRLGVERGRDGNHLNVALMCLILKIYPSKPHSNDSYIALVSAYICAYLKTHVL